MLNNLFSTIFFKYFQLYRFIFNLGMFEKKWYEFNQINLIELKKMF